MMTGSYEFQAYQGPMWGHVEIPKGHYGARVATVETNGYDKILVFVGCPECGSQFILHHEIDEAGQVAGVHCPFKPCVKLSPVRLLGWSHGKRSGTPFRSER